ncbi:HDOD domain-containing protein [Anaerocellum danielii]|uniref:HDOD domain-containing protein n=1 Tax=Anaerocellum danielii TaxID=1387557 RepID=A0ABZ0TZQ5_9FIRM|nr:HDOD domain-containing protein [Caldicellulosiruptor danielii]WPX08342.1 HDOD domain-containing protein [Caldicellulosiruptor danielii]
MSKSILFVDDEVSILKALNRAFLDEDYELYFAQSAEEALKIMEENYINLIIADMRMPNISGFELLKTVKQKYPGTIRIILSGYADENLVFRALQTNIAKLYILKPWDNERLKQIIKNIFELEDLMKAKKCLEIVNNIDYIPTLKNLYLKITKAIEDELGIDNIISAIEEDPAISSKILQVANSAFYNLKTASVKQAVVYLGLVNVRNIILNTTIFECLQDGSSKSLLWQHANIANNVFYYLYDNIMKKRVHDSYASAGLLHGIGQLILLKTYPKKYIEYLSVIKEEKGPIDHQKFELELFGISHPELGAVLLNWWDIPYPVVEAALFHHQPYDERIIHKELVCAVNIACYCAWDILGIHSLQEYPLYSIKYLNLDEYICQEIKAWFLNNNYKKE